MWFYLGNINISENIDINNCILIHDRRGRLRLIPMDNNSNYYDSITINENECINIVKYYMKNISDNEKLIKIVYEEKNKLYINTSLIDSFIKSDIFHDICIYILRNENISSFPDIETMSIVPNISLKEKSAKIFSKKTDFNIKLFDYQKKTILRMLDIEEGKNMIFNRNININIDNKIRLQIKWDPHYEKIVDSDSNCYITTCGGILADTMGLGKTITTIGLMHYGKVFEYKDNKYINSKATLIIVPSHLAKQWVDEYTKAYKTKKKIIVILTKTHHEKLTYSDFVNADIIIVTIQFLLNIKYYGLIHCKVESLHKFTIDNRMDNINEYYSTLIKSPSYMNEKQPLLDFFHFNRIIIDEGHEIMGDSSNSKSCNYIHHFLRNLHSNFKWYISGTPFTSIHGFINVINYLNFQIFIDDVNIKLSDISSWYNVYNISINNVIYRDIYSYLFTTDIIKKMISTISIRHLKDDVKDNINLLGYNEEIEWVELTKSERTIYDSKASFGSSTPLERRILQQICCHPLIADSLRKIIGAEPTSLEDVQDKLIEHHNKNIQVYTKKIDELDKSNQAYHMLLNTYKIKITESKFILSTLDKIKDIADEDNNCIICYEQMPEPVITPCGHLYCQDCINKCLTIKSECPMCKNEIKPGQLVKVKKTINKEEEDNINPLIKKYGSKLGKLIQMTRTLLSQDARIIIFSQWDDMLLLIRKSMIENGIDCSFISGNVYKRNKAISRFKLGGKDNGVILLSLENSASGTNLTEASHIIIVEPIDNSKENIKAIEGQAIGRAVRLGQKNVIKIMRILCKNTIEEEIYNNKYK